MAASQLARKAFGEISEDYYRHWVKKDPNNTDMEEGKHAPQYEKQFSAAVKKIDKLIMHTIAPNEPYKVTIPIGKCLNRTYEHENQNTPFEPSEIRGLQYMSLLHSGHNRGIMHVLGIDDELDALSPSGSGTQSVRSGTATPRSERDPNKPRLKMSLADYKAGKRPTSSSSKATGVSEHASGRNSQNGVNISSSTKDVPPPADTQKMIDQIVAQSGIASQPPRRPDARLSQTSTAVTSQTKVEPAKVKAPVAKEKGMVSEAQKNGESTPVPMKSKRSLEDAQMSTPPEKRMKVDRNSTSAQENSTSKKSALKTLPFPPGQSPAANIPGVTSKPNMAKASVRNSPTASKLSSSKEASNANPKKAKEQTPQKPTVQTNTAKAKSVDSMPPLLSPLPAGLVSPEEHVETSKKLEITPPKSPKSKSVEKATSRKKTNVDSPPSSPLPMPALLSPTLPTWVERELTRLSALPAPAAKASLLPTAAIHGVEARHERSRKPDTPGVARKTIKPKNSGAAAAAAAASKAEVLVPEKKSLILKLKYGKRNTRNVKDLLRLRPRPSLDAHSVSSTSLASSSSAPAPTPEEKKRTRPAEERSEPSAKRPKTVASLDTQKSHTSVPQAFKSPALSTPSSSQRGNAIFGTPKKGDAMKSITMRKVNSSDGFQARTPQAAMSTPAASSPASVERAKPSSTSPVPPTTEKEKAREAEGSRLFAVNHKFESLGKTLKREGDVLLKTGKDHPKPPPPVPESDRKLGTMVYIESITSFMLSFQAMDSNFALRRARNDGSHWAGMADGLIPFVERYSNAYPELHALICLLAIICREQVEQRQLERLTEAPTTIDSAFAQKIGANAKARSFLQAQYAKHRAVHDKVRFIVTVDEARKLTAEVLERFAKDNSIKWSYRLENDSK